MKIKLVNLAPINEYGDYDEIQDLKDRLAQVYREMEQEAEPEGGPITDQYADEIHQLEKEIEQAEGGPKKSMTYGDMLHKNYPKQYGPGGEKLFSTTKPDRDSFEKSSQFEGQKIGNTSYKTRTSVVTAPGKTEDKEIFIDNTDDLNNVTIRWRGANHHGNKTLANLKFFKESEFDEDLMAISNDSKWLFIVDTDEETGEVDWDTLIIDSRELENVADDGTSTYSVPDEDMMNETTEKSWNALDVSRKAEKEIDNKEWNSRTTAKLDMLIALNAAGKFKKDFGDERLQGWVDQNYSWEKLSRQFKMDEGSCGTKDDTTTKMREVIKREIAKLHGPKITNESYMGNSGDEVMISKTGSKAMPSYVLEKPDGSAQINMTFSSPLEAQKYAKKRNLKLFHKTGGKINTPHTEGTSLDDKLRGALGDEDFEKATSRKVPGFADLKPEPKEKKSKFKKAGEQMGFDMRGLK